MSGIYEDTFTSNILLVTCRLGTRSRHQALVEVFTWQIFSRPRFRASSEEIRYPTLQRTFSSSSHFLSPATRGARKQILIIGPTLLPADILHHYNSFPAKSRLQLQQHLLPQPPPARRIFLSHKETKSEQWRGRTSGKPALKRVRW